MASLESIKVKAHQADSAYQELKAEVVKAIQAGIPTAAAARAANVSRQTAARWIKEHKENP